MEEQLGSMRACVPGDDVAILGKHDLATVPCSADAPGKRVAGVTVAEHQLSAANHLHITKFSLVDLNNSRSRR